MTTETSAACTYQIIFQLSRNLTVQVGRLGLFCFPRGRYVYTGSAKRNMAARLARHKRKDKKLRWHIDYLLSSPYAKVIDTRVSDQSECVLNQKTRGEIVVKGFGASDCKAKCGSHLKFIPEHRCPE